MVSPQLHAWLDVIATQGWRRATAQVAAEHSGLSMAEITGRVGDRFDALSAFQEYVSSEAAQGAANGGSVRERLFDGMMQGFDALQEHRVAVLAIWKSRDPAVLALVGGRFGLHVRRLAIASGVDVRGIRGRLRLVALAALAARAFHIWRTDDSADMSATMAELDRLLDKADKAERNGISPDLVGLPGFSALGGRFFRAAPPADRK